MKKLTLLLVFASVLTPNFIYAQCAVPAAPTISLPATLLCANTPYQFAATAMPGHTYNWSYDAGATVIGPTNEQTITLSFETDGYRGISVRAINSCGNSSEVNPSLRYMFKVLAPVSDFGFEPMIAGSTNACPGTYNYELQTAYPAPFEIGKITTISWSVTGGNIITPVPDPTVFGMNTSASVQWNSPGTYTITVTASNACGGPTKSKTLSVTVVSGTKPTVSLINNLSERDGFCIPPGGITRTYTVTGTSTTSYAWVAPSFGTMNASGNSATITYNNGGASWLSVTPSNAVCTGEVRKLWISASAPTQGGTITSSSSFACPDTPITLIHTGLTGSPTYYVRKFVPDSRGGLWSSWSEVPQIGNVPVFTPHFNDFNISPASMYEFRANVTDWNYAGCSAESDVLSIPAKMLQTLILPALSATTYGSVFSVNATTNASPGITYSSSNQSVATSNANSITAVNVGATMIYARHSGDASYCPAEVWRDLTVIKAPLTAKANDLTRQFGFSNPTLTISYSGFVNGQNSTVIDSQPTAYTPATPTTTPGTYSITLSGGSDNHYIINKVAGTLTVTKRDQLITFPAITTKCIGNVFSVTASAASGLPVTFSSSNTAVATVSGNTVTIVGYGIANIVATQAGNINYNMSEVSQALSIYAKPSVTALTATTFCQGGSVELSATGGPSYQWRKNGLDIANEIGATYAATQTGNYSVKVINAAGCQMFSEDVAVVVNPVPSANITPASATSFCPGGSVILNASAGVSYQWLKEDVELLNATSGSYLANVTGNYKVRITNAWGCVTTSAAVTVTVNPTPVTIITQAPAASFCQGSYVQLNSNSESNVDYTWFKNGTPISSSNFSSYNATQAGSYSVQKKYRSTLCLSESSPVAVTEKLKPVLLTSASKIICSGSSVDLDLISNIPGTTFSWIIMSKSSNLTGIGPGSTVYTMNPISLVYSNVTTGSGSVVFRVTPFANGCYGDYRDITVTVNGKITAAVVGVNQTICSYGDPLAFTQTGSVSGPGNITYLWKQSVDNVNFENSPGGSVALYNVGPGLLTQTTYYQRTVTSYSNGIYCSAQSGNSVVITVNQLSPGTIAGDQTICVSGNPSMLTTTPATGPGTPTYYWEKSTTSSSSGYSSAGSSSASFDPPVLTQTTYYRRRATFSACGSTAVNSNAVTILVDDFTVSINQPTTKLCAPVLPSIGLHTQDVPGYSYVWKRNGTPVYSGTGSLFSSYQVSQPGSYTVTVTTSGGCTKTSSTSVVNQSSGAGIITATGTFCEGGYVDLTAGEGLGYYNWSTGETTQTIRVYAEGRYSVSYHDPCPVSASYRVAFPVPQPGDPCVYARTGKPDSEGTNDEDSPMTVTLYPNPVDKILTITLPEGWSNETTIILHDSFGKKVYESVFAINEKRKTISMSDVMNGIYLVQLQDSSGGKVTRRVLVRH